jgi:hypothetical protein
MTPGVREDVHYLTLNYFLCNHFTCKMAQFQITENIWMSKIIYNPVISYFFIELSISLISVIVFLNSCSMNSSSSHHSVLCSFSMTSFSNL